MWSSKRTLKVYYGRAGSLCYADFALIPRGSNGGCILSLSSNMMAILTHNIAHRSWAPITSVYDTGRNLCDCGISPSPSTKNTMPTCDTYCGGSMNCNNNAVSDVDGEDKCMQTTTCELWVIIVQLGFTMSHSQMLGKFEYTLPAKF